MASAAVGRSPWLVILGPTGVGKTKLSLQLAQHFGGEIINTDAIQLYHGLDIATNKATAEERALAPHHLLDELDPDAPWTVVDFHQAALPRISEIEERGKVPVLVGGTHYYLEALLFETLVASHGERGGEGDGLRPESHEHSAHPDLLAAINEGTLSSKEMHAKLEAVDAVMARRLHPNNVRKVHRSLEVYATRGVPHSELLAAQAAAGPRLRHRPVCCFWLDTERAILDQRLDARVDSMLEQGLLYELLAFYVNVVQRRPPALVCQRGDTAGDGSDNGTAKPASGDMERKPNVPEGPPPEDDRSPDAGAASGGGCPELSASDTEQLPPLDYTRGILQAIGLKEFQPLFDWLAVQEWPQLRAALREEQREPATAASVRSDGALQELLAAKPAIKLVGLGIEAVQAATRRYARRQIKWITGRLRQRREGYFFYRLDTSHPEEWEKLVLEPAIAKVDAIAEGRPEPSEATEAVVSGADRLTTLINRHCDVCDRIINGDEAEWQAHIASRRHRRSLGRKNRDRGRPEHSDEERSAKKSAPST